MANEVYRIGPCHVFIGNPNIPAGAGMTFLGFTRDAVEFTPNVNISFGKVDQVGTSGLAESVYFGGHNPVVTIPLVDEDKDKLEAYMAYASQVTEGTLTSVGGGSGFLQIPVQDIGTLACIPSAQLGDGTNGVDAAQGLWLPAVIARDLGSWMFETPDGSDDAMNRRATQFAALRRGVDDRAQTTAGSLVTVEADKVLLPTSHRIWFIGSPGSIPDVTEDGVTHGAPTWSLPSAPRG